MLGVVADRAVTFESARIQEARANSILDQKRPSQEETEDAAMLIGTDVSRPNVSALAALDEFTPKATRVSLSR